MVVASNYCHVSKFEASTGKYFRYTPMRAIGLAVEKGLTLSKTNGVGSLMPSDVKSVCISSPIGVRMLQDGTWRKVDRVQLDVQEPEQSASLNIVKHIRSVVSELGLNLWYVDMKMPGGLGFHDLVGDFSGPTNYGSLGLNSTEIKVFSVQGIERKTQTAKNKALTRFQSLQKVDGRYTGLLFICVTIATEGPGAWSEPRLTADLWMSTSGWNQLGAFGRRHPKLKVNRTLTQILGAMRFYEHDGQQLALVSDFVRELGLKKRQTYNRCKVWNTRLNKVGFRQLFVRIPLDVANPGRAPWVGSRELFKQVWRFL